MKKTAILSAETATLAVTSSNSLPSLRSRLMQSLIVSTIITFVVLGAVFGRLLWQSLHQQMDHHIHLVLMQLFQIVTTVPPAERERLIESLTGMEGMTIAVVEGQSGQWRTVLQRTSADVTPLSDQELLNLAGEVIHDYSGEKRFTEGGANETAARHSLHQTTHQTVGGRRFGRLVLPDAPPQVMLLVGESTEVLEQSYWRLMQTGLAALVLLLSLFTFFFRHWLRSYLAPLEEIARQADLINDPRQPDSRYDGTPETRELSVIGTAYNRLIDRLADLFRKEHEFFSAAAHTLKTPLAVVRAKLDQPGQLSARQRQDLIATIDSAVAMTNDLLLISRLETADTSTPQKASAEKSNSVQMHSLDGVSAVSFSELIIEHVELFGTLAQDRTLELNARVQSGITVVADQRLLRRALSNVFDNAVRYARGQGNISVTLSYAAGSNNQQASTQGVAVLTIANPAVGLLPADCDRLFERFYRGKNSRDYQAGSGLGLAITRSVFESLQGNVGAQLRAGRLTITARLPALLQSDHV